MCAQLNTYAHIKNFTYKNLDVHVVFSYPTFPQLWECICWGEESSCCRLMQKGILTHWWSSLWHPKTCICEWLLCNKPLKHVKCISLQQIATESEYWADINNAIKFWLFTELLFDFVFTLNNNNKKLCFSGSVTLQAMRDSMSLPAYKFISL